ncbi:MAG TPA: NUDIX hydrolase [Candidatus Saccharibacteria bacterium]|nr:NUDIX hydrolase [Candidatus Saccharibacteria bacterium]HMR38425.1 NUDIX hydrolase [Candidatus Saccharibacteria bacterium]
MHTFTEEETKQFLARLERRASGANMLIEDEQGRLLTVKMNYESHWGLPGGWVEGDETPLQTALRETREELQLDLSPDTIQFVRLIDMRYHLGHIYISIFRLMEPVTNVQISLQENELEEYGWVTKEQVLSGEDGRAYSYAINLWAADDSSAYNELDQTTIPSSDQS